MKRLIHSSTSILGMAVADKDSFNIPYDIWLDPAEHTRNVKHNMPRVKVDIGNERVPYFISKEPRSLVKRKIKGESDIKKFVHKNYDKMIAHWNHEILDKDILNELEPL